MGSSNQEENPQTTVRYRYRYEYAGPVSIQRHSERPAVAVTVENGTSGLQEFSPRQKVRNSACKVEHSDTVRVAPNVAKALANRL